MATNSPGVDGEVDVAECRYFEFAGAVGFAEVLGEDDGRSGGIRNQCGGRGEG